MITFQRALIAAFCFLTILYFTTHTRHSSLEGSIETPSKESSSSHTSNAHNADEKKNANSQQLLHDMPNASLLEKLEYQFPYDIDSKFPAYIWQTWKFTPASGEFDEALRPAEASWTEKHPTFVHEVITNQVALHLLRHLYASIPEVLQAYKSLPSVLLKADFFRYLILLARGGIYSDIDTFALKSIALWLPDTVPVEAVGLILGIEADPQREDWATLFPRQVLFCQRTILSKPGHPILREIVANITQETVKKAQEGSLSNLTPKDIAEFTGPIVWTDIVFNFMNDARYFDMSSDQVNITWEDFTGLTSPKKAGDVVILPLTSFNPGTNNAGDFDDPMAFVKHGVS